MTRLLYLPDDQSFLLLESRLPPAALVKAVADGVWQPPEPYPGVTAENLDLTVRPKLCAFHLGRMVVVIPEPPPCEEQGLPSTLSPRQQQVLQLMACGLNTKQIASRLHLTSRAVLFHVATLKARLQAASRPELISKAIKMGLLEKGSLDQS
jgi:DNA-binding NarL/FixJ family response regulator